MMLFGAVVAKCFFFIRGFLFNKIYLFCKISNSQEFMSSCEYRTQNGFIE